MGYWALSLCVSLCVSLSLSVSEYLTQDTNMTIPGDGLSYLYGHCNTETFCDQTPVSFSPQYLYI